MPEREFGRYLIQDKLGEGSIGSVYLAYDTMAREAVAIKVFNPACQTLLRDAQNRSRLKHHLLSLSQSRHPTLVPVISGGQIAGRFFLVTPFLPGGDLATRLRRGKFSPEQAIAVLRPIATALDFIHRRGILHHDLTPHNILFDQGNQAHLADVGLTRLFIQMAPGFRNTAGWPYLAPEQHLRESQLADQRADTYSLGVILYEMLAGAVPFTTKSDSLVWEHLYQPVPILAHAQPDLSSRWQPVIEKALAKSPDVRFQTAAALVEAASAVASPAQHPLRQVWETTHRRLHSEVTRLRGRSRWGWRPATHQLKARRWRWPFWLAGAAITALLLLFVLVRWPVVGARLADPLRGAIGEKRVAFLEEKLFRFQDSLTRAKTTLGLTDPEPPWQPDGVVETSVASATPAPTLEPIPSPTLVAAQEERLPVLPTPAPTTAPPEWQRLANLEPLGTLAGEGVWSPYLYDGAGNIVAQRTYLQPDPERPETYVAIVAFDLTRVRLNLVLGTEDPALSDGPHGAGQIPLEDHVASRLIATFNGGFKATHGNYGAMAQGVLAIPARAGYATITIDSQGRTNIGEWGRDLFPSTEYVAYRQNAFLIIQDGAINPKVYSNAIEDWGGTINGEIITWRSGLGLSPEGEILYYFAGPGLSMPALALAMQTAQLKNAVLLDINEYWVHFAAIETHDGSLEAIPLIADGMGVHQDRYLKTSERDFFYITMR